MEYVFYYCYTGAQSRRGREKASDGDDDDDDYDYDYGGGGGGSYTAPSRVYIGSAALELITTVIIVTLY